MKLCREGYYFEPSVAESIFERMLGAERNITVMRGWRLKQACTAAGRLVKITVVNHITGDADAARTAPRQHVDSIAVGEFPIDSFPCRRRQPSDTIVLEGYLGMLDYVTRPYEIPYGIMIPRELDGVIVPVAASTTHVGYSSIRMEPTWMALGQAAGTAAHLAIAHQVTPRQVLIALLQENLRRQGQVLRHADSN